MLNASMVNIKSIHQLFQILSYFRKIGILYKTGATGKRNYGIRNTDGILAEQSQEYHGMWIRRIPVEQRNNKTTPRNTTTTERRHIESMKAIFERILMEKQNRVRRQVPRNKFANQNEKQNIYKRISNVLKLNLFSQKEGVHYFTLLFLFNLVLWSPCALQSTYQQINVPVQEENVYLKFQTLRYTQQNHQDSLSQQAVFCAASISQHSNRNGKSQKGSRAYIHSNTIFLLIEKIREFVSL